VRKTIADYARCARLAQKAGYDGVEIMGSEGYLINQFIAPKTNHRTDEWGGPFENRIRFAVEIVRRTREKVGPNFIIIFRLSMLDLVEDGSTWEEVVQLAKAIEAAGATIINTGIGWHEARIPTIATMVPRAAFTWVTRRMKGEVKIPLVTTNRINAPDVAEDVLARGDADMVSMARPFLADAEFVNKAAAGRADEINTCIACNQACLDHIFERKTCSCLVNPRACHETELVDPPAARRRRSPSSAPARRARLRHHRRRARPRRHAVRAAARSAASSTWRSASPARRNSARRCATSAAASTPPASKVKVSHRATAEELAAGGFDHVALATGVTPRTPDIPGSDHPKVARYIDMLEGRREAGTQSRHRRRRRHRLRRRRAPDPRRRPAQRHRPLPQRVGHRRHLRRARRPEEARRRAAAAPDLAAAAQDQQGRRRPGQDHRLDPPHPAQAPQRQDAGGRELREDRRRRPAPAPRRRNARCSTSTPS
jgi:2,4-dienoyl-CoA reductase (NADPH2)